MIANQAIQVKEEGGKSLLFAVPKKGRLYERIVKLLQGAGLYYNRPARVDIAKCKDLPVTLVFLPAADIAKYVGEGKVDLGITGQDIIAESNVKVNELEQLGFGKCKLAVQAPVADKISDPAALAGKRIVTSFPKLAKEYFEQFETPGNPTHITFVGGSVEAACGLGLADGIVDLVETGTTMKAAGLEMVSTIMETQTVLISNPQTDAPDLVEKIHKRILGYIVAKRYNLITYNISRSLLDEAKKITPGRKAPTISALESSNGDMVAVSSMVLENETANIMDRLVEVGATDIFLMDIVNCRA